MNNEQLLDQAYDLLCEVEAEIDNQTFDRKSAAYFDLPDDTAFQISITFKSERRLSEALKLIEQMRGTP